MQSSSVSPVRLQPAQNRPANIPSFANLNTTVAAPQPRATWADLPEDILHQLMAWLMNTEGSGASVGQLSAVSKSLHKCVQTFRDSATYLGLCSELEHSRAGEATRIFLKNLINGPVYIEGIASKNDLERFLQIASERGGP